MLILVSYVSPSAMCTVVLIDNNPLERHWILYPVILPFLSNCGTACQLTLMLVELLKFELILVTVPDGTKNVFYNLVTELSGAES